MKPLSVEVYDNLRFWVRSEDKPDTKYLADLGALSGNGECTCEQFTMRLGPRVRKGESGLRCKHLESARNWLIDEIISRMAASAPPSLMAGISHHDLADEQENPEPPKAPRGANTGDPDDEPYTAF